jgi:DMSO/TMAO reductase YedYZ molybdopterin-dependent catalytic subunit
MFAAGLDRGQPEDAPAPLAYERGLPVDKALDPDTLLAWEMNDAPLPPAHGGPLRLVVPKRYGWKSVKWLRVLHFRKHDEPGFWEVRGYSNTADPWTDDRYGS